MKDRSTFYDKIKRRQCEDKKLNMTLFRSLLTDLPLSHFISVRVDYMAKLAKIYLNKIVRLHRVLTLVVSNRVRISPLIF